jgi:transcriptional regulator with XRE-family HTH domain
MATKPQETGLKYHKVRVIDHKKTGRWAAQYRKDKGLKQSQVAERMNISSPMLCYLENGDRMWTQDLMNNFMAACEKGVEA